MQQNLNTGAFADCLRQVGKLSNVCLRNENVELCILEHCLEPLISDVENCNCISTERCVFCRLHNNARTHTLVQERMISQYVCDPVPDVTR